MNTRSIYSYSDYKSYLLGIEQRKSFKGFRTRIAECTGCQNAFVSQVLNGQVNFNLEQALRIGTFLGLSDEERQYFLWMVEYKRAGTTELKNYFHNLMGQLREKNLKIAKRVQIPQVLSSEDQSAYYSSWIYSAIHVAAMIGRFNSPEKIANILDLPLAKAKSVIEFLTKTGLLEQHGQTITSGRVQIHLGNDSGNINKHHGNWRIEALKSLDAPSPSDLHYSGVSSLSEADAERIRTTFVDIIENYVREVERSHEETVYTFNLDFFRVLKN